MHRGETGSLKNESRMKIGGRKEEEGIGHSEGKLTERANFETLRLHSLVCTAYLHEC